MARKFSDARSGSAISVRIVPRANENEVVEILTDDTIKIRLASSPDSDAINIELVKFMSEILAIPASHVEIVGGLLGRDKLVSVLNLNGTDIQRKLLAKLIK
ncbi:MAG: DUF167 domain-containing protein [Chloroflexi bacterium]|jgi:uncharacterized protein YggU (UPF0235/DUF167 family)|nr:DUF167 domain-containing protein [Chloroflexota bacterium]MBT3670439.1 DUF167 domain-containing protein [Chloroflexota bacterium]MBT4002689.1 DUF167 domain-containing protein [Chloroflexota bacterium]MBT4304659.1 DUF167 domain-containing protein [Chloroflexota bacterium]MBT4534228.1 DUF167 domain-containing protein [Chloroflexota bacterium]